jgi:hypothetical protein
MNPQTEQLLGCITQEPFLRKLAPIGETKAQRKKRERESQVWERSVKQIGRVPQNCQWIYVGDSGSDIYTFWQTCEDLGYDFAIRVAQDRVIEISPEDAPQDGDGKYLKTLARALPATAARFLSVPAHEHQPKREVFLLMSFQKVRVQPPLHGDCLRKTDLTAWVIRVWETHPPQGQEPLEWILLTTVPMTCPADAWEVVQWYRWRWLLGDFHKALKTGCRMEQRSLQSVEALWNLLAILTPIALASATHSASRTASRRNPCGSSRLSRRHRRRDPLGPTPSRDCDCQAIVARYCPSRWLSRPYLRWSSWMADLMERMDARHAHLRRRSFRVPFFFFMISV